MLKKIIILSISLLSLGKSASAQTFTFTNIDTIQYGSIGATLVCNGTLVNNSSTGFYVDALRLVNDTAPNWYTYMCLDVCYPPQVDSARVYLPANSTQPFVLDFVSDAFLPDSSTVFMKFKNVSSPANVIYQKYYAITEVTSGVNEQGSSVVDVRIFPSPVQPNSTFCFRISQTAPSSEDYSLVLYDLIGGKATRIDNLMNGDNYISLNLPEGIFIYNLVRDGRSVRAGRIAIVKGL